jgi:hypothetical protein
VENVQRGTQRLKKACAPLSPPTRRRVAAQNRARRIGELLRGPRPGTRRRHSRVVRRFGSLAVSERPSGFADRPRSRGAICTCFSFLEVVIDGESNSQTGAISRSIPTNYLSPSDFPNRVNSCTAVSPYHSVVTLPQSCLPRWCRKCTCLKGSPGAAFGRGAASEGRHQRSGGGGATGAGERAVERCVLASERQEALQLFREPPFAVASGSEIGALYRGVLLRRVPSSVPYRMLSVPVRYRGLPVPTRSFVAAARGLGCPVHVWTVNDAATAVTLWGRGVVGMVTNLPDLIGEARKQ